MPSGQAEGPFAGAKQASGTSCSRFHSGVPLVSLLYGPYSELIFLALMYCTVPVFLCGNIDLAFYAMPVFGVIVVSR